jgi:Tfp pilus assembly protein PilO
MARNRKNDSNLQAAPILLAICLCILFAVLGLGYVGYKNTIDVLGRQIKDRETRLAELQRKNKSRRDLLATLCSPVNLEARVKSLNLGLEPPALSQIIRLVDAPDYEQAAPPPPPALPPGKVALVARKN